MYKKNRLIIILISITFIEILSGCTSNSKSNIINNMTDNYKLLEGSWVPAGIYYEDELSRMHLVDLSDNDELMDLFSTKYLLFYESGAFLYMDLYNNRGMCVEQSLDKYILKTDTVFMYDFSETGLIEKEVESSNKTSFIAELYDENTLCIDTLDPISGKAKVDSVPIIFERENTESQYILLNKTPLNDDSSSNNSSSENNETNYYPTRPSEPFDNKYGTPTTICIHSGCQNYIASSGDTNCCTQHSARCLNCNCYIDEDDMYCMSCLSEAITSPENNHSSTSNDFYYNNSNRKDSCNYKYPSGEICGNKTNKYENLCDRHFDELNAIYQSLTN